MVWSLLRGLLIWILFCAALTMLGIVWAMRYARRKQLFDQPGERRSHVTVTPRGGGIAIVITLLLVGGLMASSLPFDRMRLEFAFVIGLVLVAGIGWLDDHRPLSPWLRLAVHAIASLLLAWATWEESGMWWMALVAFVLSMVLVNVWNFMDGINGLATSQAMIAATGFAWLLPPSSISFLSWLPVTLAAATAGFLPFNFPRARIFLGDVGSGSLGYALATLMVVAWGYSSSWAGLVWLALPVCAFVVDAGLTLAWRMMRGERWWMPHVEHAYQRWAKRRGHVTITIAYAVFSLLATGLMVYGYGRVTTAQWWLAVLWYLLATAFWFRGHARQRGQQ
jgi:UDP-N-acetylmuramyl pentapeptide phosphotransferase/UDP-N-acetylglucosamine-1-phosphate transferase